MHPQAVEHVDPERRSREVPGRLATAVHPEGGQRLLDQHHTSLHRQAHHELVVPQLHVARIETAGASHGPALQQHRDRLAHEVQLRDPGRHHLRRGLCHTLPRDGPTAEPVDQRLPDQVFAGLLLPRWYTLLVAVPAAAHDHGNASPARRAHGRQASGVDEVVLEHRFDPASLRQVHAPVDVPHRSQALLVPHHAQGGDAIGVGRGALHRVVGGSVVDHEHLHAGQVLCDDALHAGVDEGGALVGRHDHRDVEPRPHRRCRRTTRSITSSSCGPATPTSCSVRTVRAARAPISRRRAGSSRRPTTASAMASTST